MNASPPSLLEERCIPVRVEGDIVTARKDGRALSATLGFSGSEQALIATAISELARNMLDYAGGGEVVLGLIEQDGHRGIAVLANDRGPGIADLDLAMQDGYTTSGGLGLGLPGARRLMDDFVIDSQVGVGTRVTVIKWKR